MGDPFVLYWKRRASHELEAVRPPPSLGSHRTGQTRCNGLFAGPGTRAFGRRGPTLTRNIQQPHNLCSHPYTQMCLSDSQINPDANSTTLLDRAGRVAC